MSKGYDFYLDKCLLPITPEKLQITYPSGNKRVILINQGQITLLKTPLLAEIEFSCIVPAVKYPFAREFREPEYYLNYFSSLQQSKKPFQFIAARERADGQGFYSTNITVSAEDISVSEDAAKGMDTEVKIKLRQYRSGTVKVLSSRGISSDRPDSVLNGSRPLTIGCDVIVTGRLFGTSYGDAPGQYRTNYRGKLNFINLKGSHPYHITTPSGLWQGWVTKESIRAVL